MSAGGEGYLNFMGNEFGHPEWIDFPREDNGWSYFYCRRQWHLADDKSLKYEYMLEFDRAMIALAKEYKLFGKSEKTLFVDGEKQIIVYERGGVVFAFNFSPVNSYEGYMLRTRAKGSYKVIMSTDEERFGGWDRISKDVVYKAEKGKDKKFALPIYLPARTAMCLTKVKEA